MSKINGEFILNLPKGPTAMGLIGGLGLLLIGLASEGTERWAANGLLVGWLLVGWGLAAILFLAIESLTASHWSVVFRRVVEAITFLVYPGVVIIWIVFLFKLGLYPWVESLHFHYEGGFKEWWLQKGFFLLRAGFYTIIWLTFQRLMIGCSRGQDSDGTLKPTRRLIILSALFLPLYAITYWLASFDWVMSLEPHWYSTIFGVYQFSGSFVGGLALLAILVIWFKSQNPYGYAVSREHFHDIGKLLFAFSTFWMYIWFSQYMLIWYANIPEEAVYFTRRMKGIWQPLALFNIGLNWVLPFLTLMPLATKRSPSALVRISAGVLVGRWLDHYLMIMPPVMGSTPKIGLSELGWAVLMLGLVSLTLRYGFHYQPSLPFGDPRLGLSIEH